jgi:hypothetical protein
MNTPDNSKKLRWQAFQEGKFTFPNAGSAAPTVPDKSPSGKNCIEADHCSYPQLRILLRDCGHVFKPSFKQREAAALFCKDARTVRYWIHRGQVPFHRWPSGEVYFSPQDLEVILGFGKQIVDVTK